MVISNCWSEYRRDCSENKVDDAQQLDSVNFRLELAISLVYVNQPTPNKGVGRPRLQLIREPVQYSECRPMLDIRFDGLNHLPDIDKKNFSTRCKYVGCTKRTHFFLHKMQCSSVHHRRHKIV
jgi:hypothetical protein